MYILLSLWTATICISLICWLSHLKHFDVTVESCFFHLLYYSLTLCCLSYSSPPMLVSQVYVPQRTVVREVRGKERGEEVFMVCSSLLKIAAHQWLTSPIHLKSNVTQYCGYDCTDIRPVDTDIDTYYHLIFIVHSWTLIFKIRALILKGTCCIYLYLSCTFFSLLQNDIHIWNVYYTLNIPWMLESIKHLKYTFHKA